MKKYRLKKLYPGLPTWAKEGKEVCKDGELYFESPLGPTNIHITDNAISLSEVENFPEFWEEVDNTIQIYKFVGEWKPVSKLSYKRYINASFWVWCEYPMGGAARRCVIRHIRGDYIYCDVELEYMKITQGAVAWSDSYNQPMGNPYYCEEQRKIWRQIVNLTNIRQIKYEYE